MCTVRQLGVEVEPILDLQITDIKEVKKTTCIDISADMSLH